LLRSYDSRKETAPEFNCTIWQAGRATSATGLAFKPIQIGQSVFIDEGAGKYNPGPVILDEATINEWPGREVGVFVSIGTGKRPAGSDANQHLWYEDFMGDFAEARKRLVAKIEGCEETHQYMLKEYLAKRGVNPDNYYRLNVEIGVGEFGMNEWNRLADISTGTRRYLGKPDVQRMNIDASVKLAKIHKSKERLAGRDTRADQLYDVPEASPFAFELPAEIPADFPSRDAPPRPSYESGRGDNLTVPSSGRPSPRTSDEQRRPGGGGLQPPTGLTTSSSSIYSQETSGNPNPNDDRFVVSAPTPLQYRTNAGAEKIAVSSQDEYNIGGPEYRVDGGRRQSPAQGPPPLPPKTPILEKSGRNALGSSGNQISRPPYPLDDGPPPVVNMARKPEYKGR
jgi:hypothetical protein